MTTIDKKDITLVLVATVTLALAAGLIVNVQQVSFAQEVVTEEEAAEVITTTEPPTVAETDLLLENINATFIAVSGLISTATAIIVYILNTIRSKTGDKIVSTDLYNKTLDVLAQVRQKDNELRDVYRQVLENKEIIKVSLDMVKGTNPEIAQKIEEGLPQANKAIEAQVRPQILEWQIQADRFYDTLLKKKPIVGAKS